MNTHHGVALYFSSMKCIRLWARTRVALYHRQTEQKKSNLRKISVNAVEQTAAAISAATIAAHFGGHHGLPLRPLRPPIRGRALRESHIDPVPGEQGKNTLI